VKINGDKVEDKQLIIKAGSHQVYQVGKRKFAKIEIL
jgi:tyrosyl-tRNA synthetase